jgi:hypothetical protein
MRKDCGFGSILLIFSKSEMITALEKKTMGQYSLTQYKLKNENILSLKMYDIGLSEKILTFFSLQIFCP